MFTLSCPVHHIELGIMHLQENETIIEYVISEITQIVEAEDNIWQASD